MGSMKSEWLSDRWVRGCGKLAVLGLLTLNCAAAPGEGIALTPETTLNPFVKGSLSFDSNVFLTESNEQDDVFFDLIGGVSLLTVGEDLSFSLEGYGQLRSYQDYSEEDNESYKERLGLVWGSRENLQLKLRQSLSDVFDYELTRESPLFRDRENAALGLTEGRTRRTSRTLADVDGSLGRDFDKIELTAGASYSSVDFDDDLNDWSEVEGLVDVGYKLTDKSSSTLTGSFGTQDTDNDLEDIEFTKILVGLRTKPTDKLVYNVRVGLGSYEATDTSEFGEAIDEDLFLFDISGTWAVTEKLDLQVFGRNELQPTSAYRRNTKEVSQASIGLRHRTAERITTSLGASYRQDDFTAPVEEGIDADENLSGIRFQLAYQPPRRFMRLGLQLGYEQFDSNYREDYDQLRTSLSLNLKY